MRNTNHGHRVMSWSDTLLSWQWGTSKVSATSYPDLIEEPDPHIRQLLWSPPLLQPWERSEVRTGLLLRPLQLLVQPPRDSTTMSKIFLLPLRLPRNLPQQATENKLYMRHGFWASCKFCSRIFLLFFKHSHQEWTKRLNRIRKEPKRNSLGPITVSQA